MSLLIRSPVAVAVLVFVVTTGLGIGLWLVLTRHASSTPIPSRSPAEAVVQQYFSDLAMHDCQSAYQLLTDPIRARAGGEDAFCVAAPSQMNRSVTLMATTQVSATDAVVMVNVTKPDGTMRNDRITVLYTGSAWKLSDITAVSANGTPLFDVDAALTQIRNDYEQRSGVALTSLTCAQHGTIPAPPGTVISCAFADAMGTSGIINITVKTDDAYEWTTVTASPSPSPTPSA